MSKYTAHQIYALGQFIVANQKYFPSYQIGQQIRHLEFNAQRNLPEASEEYFKKYLHTTVEKAMEEAAKVQFELTQPAKETHAPPTSAPPGPPKRRVVVFASCAACGKDVAVAEDVLAEAEQKGWKVFCDERCQNNFGQKAQKMIRESDRFLQKIGSAYYNCGANSQMMLDYLKTHNKDVTEANLLDAFIVLRPQLLKSLTVAEMEALSPAGYAARLKIDPEMGGAIAALNASTKPQEAQSWSSNATRFNQLERRGLASQGGR
jgi:hypothetical protein